MPRLHPSRFSADELTVHAGLQAGFEMRNPYLSCTRCESPLECVEQNRRSGTWLGSFICPNCRSEYFYAYRWGRLMRRG
jgi:Zn finger protein HypA/HybF involved in hydrogenase expression